MRNYRIIGADKNFLAGLGAGRSTIRAPVHDFLVFKINRLDLEMFDSASSGVNDSLVLTIMPIVQNFSIEDEAPASIEDEGIATI